MAIQASQTRSIFAQSRPLMASNKEGHKAAGKKEAMEFTEFFQ